MLNKIFANIHIHVFRIKTNKSYFLIFNANQELNPLRGSFCIRLFIRGLHPRLFIV